VCTLLRVTVHMFLHNLLNVLVQVANKMGLQKKIVNSYGTDKATGSKRTSFMPSIC
jgi:hypothetical protein